MQTINSLQDHPAAAEAFCALAPVRLGLPESVRRHGVLGLSRLMAHTAALCAAYRKAHWQTSRATYYQLHLLFDRHHEEQADLLDALGERVRMLGGAAAAVPRDVAEESRLARAPRGREDPTLQITRLVEAHETILLVARPLARRAADDGDEGTHDLAIGQIVRLNERHSCAVGEYLAAAGTPKAPSHVSPPRLAAIEPSVTDCSPTDTLVLARDPMDWRILHASHERSANGREFSAPVWCCTDGECVSGAATIGIGSR